ncbi:hypothetical protein M378DRAFT_190562 [Amanita muscaria Koide BX008]|uniref:Ubiquinone biosynthesis monooxygenase COQ6, mitochondrial n=1 Tax=Amanita muscaria (strain Koide BX008) TaxID=946122 RepID=A0A0C2TQA9_AMAMK|nr:hypothetical protein M378DRAFT_190562 [Amanita muscaria Koide BX008]
MSLALATRSGRGIIATSKALKPLAPFSSTVGNPAENCDVVIVGGGPVGLALVGALSASDLVRQNLRVALIEASDLSKVHNWSMPHDMYSNRVSSLTNASQAFLNAIGAWDFVETSRTCAIEQMQVWDGISDARVTFDASEMGLPKPDLGMARLTENLNLQRALLRHLKHNGGIEMLDNTRVDSIERDTAENGGWPLVHLNNNRTLRARLLVGADGFNSPVRSYANISSYGWPYEVQAIVATMVHHPRGAFENPNRTAYQRFLPTGPIAFLPLSPTTSSLVWSTKPQLAKTLLDSEPGILTSMINAAFRLPAVSLQYLHDRILDAVNSGKPLVHSELTEEILWREKSHAIDSNSTYASALDRSSTADVVPPIDSDVVPPLVTGLQPGTVASFPLRYNHTDSYLGEGAGARTVLVGDAAHTIHPLAGQGLNLGLADVECLGKCIDNTLLHGGDIGSYTALLPYAQERYLQNHIMLSTVDKLHKLYSADAASVVWARTVGVEVLNELDSLKAALMMAAGSRPGSGAAAGLHSSMGWDLAAKGAETLVAGSHIAKMFGSALNDTLSGALSGFVQRATKNK